MENPGLEFVHLQDTKQVVSTMRETILHVFDGPIQPNIFQNHFKLGESKTDHSTPPHPASRLNPSRSAEVVGRVLSL